MIGIYSKTREEWCLTDIACWFNSITNVPIYDTLGEDNIDFIFGQTEITSVFLPFSGIEKLLGMKKKGKIKGLHTLVCFDEFDKATLEAAKVFVS